MAQYAQQPYPYQGEMGQPQQMQQMGNGQQEYMHQYGQPPQQYANDGYYMQQPDVGYAQQQPVEEEPVKVSMVVPEGAAPGMKLTYSAPDGQELRLTVPDGVPAGSVMTLTQDPVTKAWRCMAEPADGDPQPQQQQAPHQQYEAHEPLQQQQQYEPPQQQQRSPQVYSAPPAQQQAPERQDARVIHHGAASAAAMQGAQLNTQMPPIQYHGASASTATYPTGQAPTVISRTSYSHGMQPMPVNLSYVPPPAVGGMPMMQAGASLAMQPGQAVPRVTTYSAPPAPSMSMDPAQFNPPRQMPQGFHQDGMYEQRPSYTPPPVHMMGQNPSYTPPPQMGLMEQRPSYTPLPQVAMPSMGNMQPTMMATTAKVQPQQFHGQVLVGQTPSYVPPPIMNMMPVVNQNPSYVPPPVMGGMMPNNSSYVPMPMHPQQMTAMTGPSDGASVQLPAGMTSHGPSISMLPQQTYAAPHPGMQMQMGQQPVHMHQMQHGMTMPGVAMHQPAQMQPMPMGGAPFGFGMPMMPGLAPPQLMTGGAPFGQPFGQPMSCGGPPMGAPMQMQAGGQPQFQMQPQFGPDGMQQGMMQPQMQPQMMSGHQLQQQPMGMPQQMMGAQGAQNSSYQDPTR